MRIKSKIQNLYSFLYNYKLLTLTSLFMVLGISILIPWHMDEFGMLHRLACWQESQQVNVYRESCFDYPISIFGFEYFRAYQYAGITSSVLAAPFYFFYKSIWINYLVGFFYLVGILAGVQKSFNLPKRVIFIGLLFFPLAFTVLHDAGPVRVSLITLAWTPHLILKFLKTSRITSTGWILALSGLWIMSTEDKPYFLYLVPGIFLLAIAAILNTEGYEFLKNHFKKLFFGIGITCISALSLLLVSKVGDIPYFSYLRSMSPSATTELVQNAIQTKNLEDSLQNILLRKLSFIAIWAYFPHRVINLDNFTFANLVVPFPGIETTAEKFSSIFYLFSTIGVIALYLIALQKLIQARHEPTKLRNLFLLSSMAAFWLFATFAGGWTSHHYVFYQVSFFILLMLVFEKDLSRLKLSELIIFFSSLLALFSNWLAPVDIKASPEIKDIYAIAIELADENSIINCSSWGCYYQYSLMNKNEIPIVFVTHPDDAKKLEDYARKSDFQVLTMCSECEIESISDFYPNSQVEQITTDTKDWKLFKSKISN